jgi:Fe-S cluster biogenesis protein NfuA
LPAEARDTVPAPQDLRAVGDRIEQLLDELRATAEPRAYDRAEELLRLVTELYGAGLARALALARQRAPDLVEAFVGDDLIASLLMAHDLHPHDLAHRVEGALAGVRPFLGGHGGDVELLSVDAAAGSVRLRMLGSCDGCPSSAVTLKTAVERAILDAAPEVVDIEVDQPPPPLVSTPITLGTKPAYDECPAEMAGT